MTFNEYTEQNKKIQSKILSISLMNAKIKTLWATYNALQQRITEVCDFNIKNSEFSDYIEEIKQPQLTPLLFSDYESISKDEKCK